MADRVVRVMCRGERHRIRVNRERGVVLLMDHDVRAELALAAMGGEVCVCVAVGLRLDFRYGLSQGERLEDSALGGLGGGRWASVYREEITVVVDRAEDGRYGRYRLVETW